MIWDSLFLKGKDNIPLILFRIIFGLLVVLECWGALATGWVTNTLVEPKFTFTFLGFQWTQILLGYPMYVYFLIMGALGVFISLGLYYRISIVLFTLMWGLAYTMQKSHYNNHYYLLLLISFLMTLVPANANYSMDSNLSKKLKSNVCAQWHLLIFKAQITIVYFFAAVAKIYPGWLQGRPMTIWLNYKSNLPIIGEGLSADWLPLFISYLGIGFDLLIIPLFMIPKTRTMALILAIIFHLFNSIVFQIGIFPYFALSFVLFFYPADTLRLFFGLKKRAFPEHSVRVSLFPIFRNILLVYFLFQLIYPIRHWFIKGDVLWTEQGHRHSWRMMLRTKQSKLKIRILDKESNKYMTIDLNDYLMPHQVRSMKVRPDMIWQFAQHLERIHKKDIVVYATCLLSVNGSEYAPLIAPSVDLTEVNWSVFKCNNWIVKRPTPLKYNKKN